MVRPQAVTVRMRFRCPIPCVRLRFANRTYGVSVGDVAGLQAGNQVGSDAFGRALVGLDKR